MQRFCNLWRRKVVKVVGILICLVLALQLQGIYIEKTDPARRLLGKSMDTVVAEMGRPDFKFTDPKLFEEAWKGAAEWIWPKRYPRAEGEVWFYRRPPRIPLIYKYTVIYFNKQKRVTRVMESEGW